MPRVVLTAFMLAASMVFAEDESRLIHRLDEIHELAAKDNVKVKLKPGTYTLDRASSRHFLNFTGSNSHWDFRGVKLLIDTRLFSRFGTAPDAMGSFYCAIALKGNGIVLEGLTTENIGDHPGIQQKNKIVAISGSNVVLRDVTITTSGSAPWGYGSLFGIGGGDVRKMNGILVKWPAKDVSLIGCRVHMRAMGHAIFVQGARDTRIEDCHVDGLLRQTDEILAEKSGYAFDRNFTTDGRDYVEGVNVGSDGKILTAEMMALSEDGIRLYDRSAPDQPTGVTTIVNCTVTRMRRGICTGLGPAADRISNCEVRECVAAGFNAGSGDTIENSRSDAKYSEALCLPYMASRSANVQLEILDSRGGLGNSLLAVINGEKHRVRLTTKAPDHSPGRMRVEMAGTGGYAFYQKGKPSTSRENHLANETAAEVVQLEGASGNILTPEKPSAAR